MIMIDHLVTFSLYSINRISIRRCTFNAIIGIQMNHLLSIRNSFCKVLPSINSLELSASFKASRRTPPLAVALDLNGVTPSPKQK